MPSAVGYGGYAPRNPSGHLSRLLQAGIHADPLLLLLERLPHVPRTREAQRSHIQHARVISQFASPALASMNVAVVTRGGRLQQRGVDVRMRLTWPRAR